MTNIMKASNQWMTRPEDQRFKTLTELDAKVRGRQERSRSRNTCLNDLHAVQDGDEIALNGRTTQATLTNWAFGQTAQRLHAPAGYLRTLPTEKTVDLLNHHFETRQDEQLKVLFYEDEDGFKTQAVTSTSYGRIWDADLTKAVLRIQEDSDGKWYNPKAYAHGQFGADPEPSGLYASDRDVFIFMIDGGSMFDVGPRAKLNRGFFAWNSEVGNSSLGLMTFCFNQVCGNHIVWGASDINQYIVRHTSGAPARFGNDVIPMLHDYANQSMKPMEDTIRRATEYCLPKEGDHWWKTLAGSKRFTKGEVASALEFAKREEGKCETLWDLVQGFTASAREYDHIDARVSLEKRGSKLLEIVKDGSTAVLV
jgi:hypothetical protein